MVRPLFFEYREDPTSWLTEDQYMFGTDLLVAPLMEEGRDRGPTCPRGAGQTSRAAAPTTVGRGIDSLPARFPDLVLVRDGAPIPHAPLAQSTDRIGWSELQLAVFIVRQGLHRRGHGKPTRGRC